ncbi:MULTISPECIES: hypothetical protein [unclassified Nocardioides]|uniref:hypothetical protein n=1 Tax=unclassified Nocardioides TaxID=2615069 RepID=UPI003613BD0B
MTDDTSFDSPDGFDTALRDRMADEHPDLDRLISASTRAGTRMRRRRTALASLGGVAAGITVVGIVGASLGGAGRTPGAEPGLASDPTPTPSPTPSAVVPPPGTPVFVDDATWECSEPGDEKFTCAKDGGTVVVTVRAASSRVDYLDPAKADVLAGVHTWVSKAHGRLFATVAPSPGTTQAQVDEVGRALTWVS